MDIALAQKYDALQIAAIHKQEIGSGFLSSLPLPFLQILYGAMIVSPWSFCVVAKDKERVVGFASGVTDVKAFYRYFLAHHFFVSLVILVPTIFSSLKKILETLLYPQKGRVLPKAELLVIAITKEFQGRGVGRLLLEGIVERFRQHNIKVFKLIVGEHLKQAIRFYEKNGFVFLTEIMVHGDHVSKVYQYDIT